MKLEDFSPAQRRRMVGQGFNEGPQTDAPAAKPSKYRNVKVVTEDGVFDSKRECQYWQELKLREKAGDITGLDRQVAIELYAPCLAPLQLGSWVEVSIYRADFVFTDRDGVQHVQDVKGGKTGGTRTAIYALKRKWLFLQSGIEVEEIS